MDKLGIILLVFGFVFFVIAAKWEPTPATFKFGWAGLACWILCEILTGAGKVFFH